MTLSAQSVAQIRLKPRKAQPFFGRHPWVLDKAIASVSGQPADGDVVDLVSDAGQWIARGLFNSASKIRVRLYTWDADQPIDDALLRQRLHKAVELRRSLGLLNPDSACRLVYSEADGLCGLVVDHYAGHLILQPTARAMALRSKALVEALAELVEPKSIALRSDDTTSKLEGFQAADGAVEGVVFGERESDAVEIVEHGVRYRVPLVHGQKTGFYLDQRDNRLAAARYMAGRRVLDVCTYAGAFALTAALRGGAAEVIGIDGSAPAIAMAEENARLSGATNVRFQVGDCFDDPVARVAAGETFGAVILDPPKFAAGKRNIDAALRAYHRLNMSAVQLLEPGGILVTCCCSGSVHRDDFFEMLFGVALKSRRDIQLLEQHGAAPDHPVSFTCPESGYLKCFICRVL
ncbi:MAG: class I SAM-dependent rRNA methyltransferase [Planctomycetales bacterium]|nr:class I SAM-dependent rRNA methyltransferase [Planctomycetales bacterium]